MVQKKWGQRKRLKVMVGAALLLGSAQAQKVTIGLGYVPNVQFTPYYAAQSLGYYKSAGLDVTFQHGTIAELMPLLLQGKLDFVVGDAEDAVFARVQGAPVKYVMAMYQRLPATVFSLPGQHITKPSDLRGKVVGIPGAYGSTYFALQALLAKSGLNSAQVHLANIGFTQLQAVQSGKVNAAVGYLNNEVVQLGAAGVKANTLDLSAAYPMVGAGMITTEKVLATPLAGQVVKATQRGLSYTLAHPQAAYALGRKVFGAGGGSLDVLNASLPLIRSSYTTAHGLGASDPAHWAAAIAFLQQTGKVPASLAATNFYSNAALNPALH